MPRKRLRLPGYDYTQPGAYFVTICTYRRALLFGEVVDSRMMLNPLGEIVREEWFRSAEIRAEIELFPDEFVVMPNHIHGIVWIVPTDPMVGATGRSPLPRGDGRSPVRHGRSPAHPHGPAPRSLGAFIAGFKASVTKRINALRGTPGAPVWQRNYWEHIIRNERALNAIRRYIAANPARWHLDRENPRATGRDPLARTLARLLLDNAA